MLKIGIVRYGYMGGMYLDFLYYIDGVKVTAVSVGASDAAKITADLYYRSWWLLYRVFLFQQACQNGEEFGESKRTDAVASVRFRMKEFVLSQKTEENFHFFSKCLTKEKQSRIIGIVNLCGDKD